MVDNKLISHNAALKRKMPNNPLKDNMSYHILTSKTFQTPRYDGFINDLNKTIDEGCFSRDVLFKLSAKFSIRIFNTLLEIGDINLLLLAPSRNSMKDLVRDVEKLVKKINSDTIIFNRYGQKSALQDAISSGQDTSSNQVTGLLKESGINNSIPDPVPLEEVDFAEIGNKSGNPITVEDVSFVPIEKLPLPKIKCIDEGSLSYQMTDLSNIIEGKKIFANNGSGTGWTEINLDENGFFSLELQRRNRSSYDIQLRFGIDKDDKKDTYEILSLTIKQKRERSQSSKTDGLGNKADCKIQTSDIDNSLNPIKTKDSTESKLEKIDPYFSLSLLILDHIDNLSKLIECKKVGRNRFAFSVKQDFFIGNYQDLEGVFSGFIISYNNEQINLFEIINGKESIIESDDLKGLSNTIYEFILSNEHNLHVKRKLEDLARKEVVFFELIEKFKTDFKKYSLIPGFCLGWWQKLNNGIVTEGYWWEMAYKIKPNYRKKVMQIIARAKSLGINIELGGEDKIQAISITFKIPRNSGEQDIFYNAKIYIENSEIVVNFSESETISELIKGELSSISEGIFSAIACLSIEQTEGKPSNLDNNIRVSVSRLNREFPKLKLSSLKEINDSQMVITPVFDINGIYCGHDHINLGQALLENRLVVLRKPEVNFFEGDGDEKNFGGLVSNMNNWMRQYLFARMAKTVGAKNIQNDPINPKDSRNIVLQTLQDCGTELSEVLQGQLSQEKIHEISDNFLDNLVGSQCIIKGRNSPVKIAYEHPILVPILDLFIYAKANGIQMNITEEQRRILPQGL